MQSEGRRINRRPSWPPKGGLLFFPDKKLTDLVFENQRLNNKLTIVLPHPSPLNMRWFKANPGFENRLVEIRKIIAAYCDLK